MSKFLLEYDAALGDQLCFVPAVIQFSREHRNDYIAVKTTFPEIYHNSPFVDEIVINGTKTVFDEVKLVKVPLAMELRNMMLQDASAKQLGVTLLDKRPRLFLSGHERRKWLQEHVDYFKQFEGLLAGERLVVGLAPYARWKSRQWDVERWKVVIEWLVKEYNAIVFFLGKQGSVCPSFCNDLSGTTVRELAIALEFCDLLLSTDTGVTHMAAATFTPTVAIYGPVLSKYRAMPPVLPIQASDCIGCYHRYKLSGRIFQGSCPKNVGFKCMNDIKPDQVIEVCKKAIQRWVKSKRIMS